MTSKLVVNTIEADTGISSVSFASSISMSSTSKFHFGDAGINIGADTNINRPASGVLGFNINSSEKARIDSSGRVLIGTTTEGHENADDLTIATSGTGGITIRSGTSNSGAIYFSDATSGAAEYAGFLAYSHANNSMVFGTNTSEKLRIMSNGYFGLGINSPSRRVHIHTTGSGSDYIQFTNDTTGTTSGDGYVFGINGDEDVIHNNLEATNMRFYTSGAERLRIYSGGQVSIRNTNATSFNTGGDDLVIGNATDGQDAGITLYSHSTDNGSIFFNDTANTGVTGLIQYRHDSDAFLFHTASTERLRILSNGDVQVKTDGGRIYGSGTFHIFSGSSSGQLNFFGGSTNRGGEIELFGGSNSGIIKFRTGTSAGQQTEKLRITSGGQVVQYTNHTSGTSAHQNTGWYGDDANHYTLEYNDFNEIRAVKTVNTSDYNSIVYKREMMTEYCDIEFTLKGSSSNSQRHVGFMINADGSDTSSNFDRLVFRTNTGTPSSNQIRLDKGAGGQGFTETSSNVPSFFDGNERHIHIQIRKRTFSITVNRMGHSEYNFNARNSADLVSPRGYFGFAIYEPSSTSPEVTIRDFKITNYTQNALPAQSVAFQAEIASNVSKSSGQVVKPANNEIFDNGYGGNYNTSNYRFTAPVAGMYQFSNTHNVYSSPGGQWAGLKVNGTTLYVGNKINSMPGSGDHNMTCYAIIQLQPGDYVEAIDFTNNSQTYSGSRTWNRFEGSLIAAFK